MTEALPLPKLPIGHYQLRFRAQDPVRLPPFAGSAWRGAFGQALKRLICVTREPECAACLLYRSQTFIEGDNVMSDKLIIQQFPVEIP